MTTRQKILIVAIIGLSIIVGIAGTLGFQFYQQQTELDKIYHIADKQIKQVYPIMVLSHPMTPIL